MNDLRPRRRGALNTWGDLAKWVMLLLFVVSAGIGIVLATAPRAKAVAIDCAASKPAAAISFLELP